MDISKPVRDESEKKFVPFLMLRSRAVLSVQSTEWLIRISNSFLSIPPSLTARVAAVNYSCGTDSDLRGAKWDLDMTSGQ